MYKEKLQKLLTEKYLNDNISTNTYVRLTEKIDSLSEGKLKVMQKALQFTRKIKIMNTAIPRLAAKIAKMPEGPAKVASAARLKNMQIAAGRLKKLRAGLYVGGGASVAGAGISMAD